MVERAIKVAGGALAAGDGEIKGLGHPFQVLVVAEDEHRKGIHQPADPAKGDPGGVFGTVELEFRTIVEAAVDALGHPGLDLAGGN